MSDKNNVRIDIEGNADGFAGAAHEAEKELDGLKDAAQKTGDSLNDLAGKALPRVVDEIAAVTGVSSELVSGVAALGIGVSAAALGLTALAMAAKDGHAEMLEMNRAIAVSGGYAGQTRQDMLDLSRAVSDMGTVTVGESKAIVNALVASGKVGSQAIAEIAALADNYAAVTGTAIDKVGPKLVSLFADPAKGAAELNEQMHFLTAAQLEHIETLVEMGRKGEAQLELSNRLKDVLPEHARELGTLETAWRNTQKAASFAWDAMLGVGRAETLEDQIKSLKKQLATGGFDFALTEQDIQSQIASLQAKIDKQNADKEAKAANAVAQENGTRARGIIDKYSDAKKRAAKQQEMDFLKANGPGGAEQAEALKKLQEEYDKIGQVKAPRARAEKKDDSAFKERLQQLRDEAKAEAELINQRQKADALLASYERQDAIAVQRIARSAELAAMSERERTAVTAMYQVEDQSARRQEQIIKQITDETARTKALATEKNQLAAHIDKVREASLKAYDDQRSFEFGWNKAFQGYEDAAGNAAQHAQDVFKTATDGMADAMTEFAVTGKLSFSSLANDVIRQIMRMQMQAAAAGIVKTIGGFFGLGSSQSFAEASIGRDINSAGLGGYHSGGIVGSEPSFIRYHTGGIAGDEVPAILKRGEGVFTEGQMKAMGGTAPVINMTVINQGAGDGYQAQSSVRENNGKLDIEVLFVKAMQNDLKRNGPMTQGIGQVFGLNRSAA